MNGRLIILLGASLGFLTVALGAFGTHILKTQLTVDAMNIFEKAVYYQGMHSFALLITGLLVLQNRQPLFILAGWSFLAGTLLFSGSLYLLALTGIRELGIITPIGGTAFLAGWLMLGIGAWRLSDISGS